MKPQFLILKGCSFLWDCMCPKGTWCIMHFSQSWASTNKSIPVGSNIKYLECTLIFIDIQNTLSTLSFNTIGEEKTYSWILKKSDLLQKSRQSNNSCPSESNIWLLDDFFFLILSFENESHSVMSNSWDPMDCM